MKKRFFFLSLALIPYLLLAQKQKNKEQYQHKLDSAIELNQAALFTASLKICDAQLINLSKKKYPKIHIDFLIISGKNLNRINKPEEAIKVLLEAKMRWKEKFKKENIQYLDILNGLAYAYFLQSDCENMITTLELAESIFKNIITTNEFARTYDLLGIYWGEMRQSKISEKYFNRAMTIRELNRITHPLDLYHSYLYKSRIEAIKGHYQQSNKGLSTGFEILQKHGGNYYQKSDILRAFAINYNEMGDYDTAIKYSEEALFLLSPNSQNAPLRIASIYQAIGNAYQWKKDYSNAKIFFTKALSSLEFQENPSGLYERGIVLFDYSIIWREEGNFKKADSLLKKSQSLFITSQQKCNWHIGAIGQVYATSGNVLMKQKKYKEAIATYKENIQLIENFNGNLKSFLIQPLLNIGLTHMVNSQYDSAQIYYTKAQSLFLPNEVKEDDFAQLPNPIQYSSLIWFIGTNYYLKYLVHSDTASLRKAYYYTNMYVKFIDFLRKGYQDEITKINFAAENKIAYERCMQLILELEAIQPNKTLYKETFTLLEKSKSLALFEAFKLSQPQAYQEPSDTLLNYENIIRSETEALEQLYYSYQKNFGVEDEKTQTAQSDFFNAQKKYQDFLEILKRKRSSYYNSRYQPEVINLETMQQNLKPNQCLVHFYEGNFRIFIAFIAKDKYKVFRVDKDFPLTDWVSQLRTGITAYYTKSPEKRTDALFGESMTQYIEYAQKLYDKLIAPIASEMANFPEVIIIPDGQLSNIPFESLLESSPKSTSNFNTYPFLIRKHQFFYCYSATLLKEMEEKKHKVIAPKQLVALAPFASNLLETPKTSSLRRKSKILPYSKEESMEIAKIWDGAYLLDNQATKEFFIKNSPDFRILHLSTHGTANLQKGTQSFIEFTNNDKKLDSLKVRELYNLALNADLVVLSACETNLGEVQIGEGIISIARAFAYAGAKSIFATLWQVNDNATKDLSINFYQNLKQNRKAKALHLAKLGFLRKEANNAQKHPFFWAAMIPIGDMSALD